MAFIFENVSTDIVTILLIILTSVYFYFQYKFAYWKRRGVKYLTPSIPFGHFGQTFLQQKQMAKQVVEYYHRTTEPFIGLFAIVRPVLLVRDLELLRHIMVKDFHHFVDRGTYLDEKNDPLSAHLFSLRGDKWKSLRAKLSPTFTSGKLKSMFSTLLNCGVSLQTYMDVAASKGDIVEMRELSAEFTTNVIASVAFGVDIDCIKNPNTSFRKFGRKFFQVSRKNGLRFTIFRLFPKLMKPLGLRLVERDIEDFMTALVNKTIEHREKNNIHRKDFFQLLLQLRNTGTVHLDDEWETVINADEGGKKLTLAEMTAQAFVFFVAGFETTSTTISFCLFEIARNPDIQRRVHAEIDKVLAKHNGEITYESASEMHYLDNCIYETLRKYPALPLLNRECTEDYQLPGTDIVLEKGTAIVIPSLALHRDENYFPEPMKFNPDRFADETAGPTMSYLPFGDGPRMCIGMRLGKMQTKVAIMLMLQRCQVELGEKKYYSEELTFAPEVSLLAPISGIQLKISPR